ncbi:MAG: (2Fe-2S)-binding protein [Myxococcales bacterium]|nr:(2Fe-2S)-binding protein [Myxococcales bacterium]
MGIALEVNGRSHEIEASPDTPLLHVLRDELGLIAAKLGCSLEQCGACTVLVDGQAQFACRLPVGELLGRSIVTLEGLGTPDAPHALQRAFLAENAAQCGYCTAGIVVRAAALLARRSENPRGGELDDQEIRVALRDHLCRCGAHNRMVRAIRRAAQESGS